MMLMADGDSTSHDKAATPRPHFEEFDSAAAAAADAGYDGPRAAAAHAAAVASETLVLEELDHVAALHTPPPQLPPPASVTIKVVNRSRYIFVLLFSVTATTGYNPSMFFVLRDCDAHPSPRSRTIWDISVELVRV